MHVYHRDGFGRAVVISDVRGFQGGWLAGGVKKNEGRKGKKKVTAFYVKYCIGLINIIETSPFFLLFCEKND